MWTRFSQRLLTLLQLTRMALVFTAIADGQAALLLSMGVDAAGGPTRPGLAALLAHISWRRMVEMALISIGLYGFGMSLNDIIDHRRDRLMSPLRPLPSGRLNLPTAHAICIALAATALISAVLFRHEIKTGYSGGATSLAMVWITLGLIVFYDAAGKYLVGPGLITLGLVRFCHALIPAFQLARLGPHTSSFFDISRTATGSLRMGLEPHVAAIFHPLWLLNHVTILSAVAYSWEEKRPTLDRKHWIGLIGALTLIDTLTLAIIARIGKYAPEVDFRLEPGLLLPAGASLAFIFFAWQLRRRIGRKREAGQRLMLFGLLWLIVYDACFVAIYVYWMAALFVLLLLPTAYGCVILMRWWARLISVSQRPSFKRAGT